MPSFFPMLEADEQVPAVAAVHFALTAEDLALLVQARVEQRVLCSVLQEMKVKEEPAVLR